MGNKSQRRCVWCGASGLTLEHVFSAWMRDMMPKTSFTVNQLQRDGTYKTWQSPLLELKTKMVCGSCNNKWGSDLEGRLKDAIGDLILEQKIRTFTPSDCKAIADFAFKTTVLANHMKLVSGAPFFSELERKNFATHRIIPSGVQVWVAMRGTPFLHGTFRSIYGISKGTKPNLGMELYTCTFSIGWFLLQCFATRWTDRVTRNLFSPPPVKQPDALGADIVRIFPDNVSVQWPPDKLIGDDLMDWFWQRFNKIDIPASWNS